MSLTNFPNGITSFGVPIHGRSSGTPIFGTTYWVDANNGSSSYEGLEPSRAKATIQQAINLQIANTTGLGDVIYVLPGVYTEGLTGPLTKVSLIAVGGNWGYGPNAAVIYPASASGLDEITTNQVEISNFTFVSPSTSTTLPAVHFANMRWTTFNNNALIGGAAACITGLQVGNEDAVATAANCDFNRISNNYFGTVFGTSAQFQYGIKVGRAGYDAGASVKQCMSTVIENNTIAAAINGIYLGVYGGKADGTIIRNNYITSWEGGSDEGTSGPSIMAYTASQAMVCDNYCATAATAAAINGFQAGHVLGNLTSQNGTAKLETQAA
jgi:hypothetical protein